MENLNLSEKIKGIKPCPTVMDMSLPKRDAIDERLILRLHLWGYRIIIYKTRKR